ncbi:transcriptional regulator [Microcoleus sp. FACHB-1515]|uniref:transcriptional regulator n=1 Tax=Cyanophyceae TaxID=3028117 RepID=UPI001689771E|nr:transcriptional regulator [Microcoleus sp. FACHB-1515]MBD2089272.1 transcriptional regulator [Microcoleus sp. FACHB-1515]
MSATEQSELAALLREMQSRLELSQVNAEKIKVLFQSVNGWKNGRTKPLPVALKQTKQLPHQIRVQGENLLAQYFGKPQR